MKLYNNDIFRFFSTKTQKHLFIVICKAFWTNNISKNRFEGVNNELIIHHNKIEIIEQMYFCKTTLNTYNLFTTGKNTRISSITMVILIECVIL